MATPAGDDTLGRDEQVVFDAYNNARMQELLRVIRAHNKTFTVDDSDERVAVRGWLFVQRSNPYSRFHRFHARFSSTSKFITLHLHDDAAAPAIASVPVAVAVRHTLASSAVDAVKLHYDVVVAEVGLLVVTQHSIVRLAFEHFSEEHNEDCGVDGPAEWRSSSLLTWSRLLAAFVAKANSKKHAAAKLEAAHVLERLVAADRELATGSLEHTALWSSHRRAEFADGPLRQGTLYCYALNDVPADGQRALDAAALAAAEHEAALALATAKRAEPLTAPAAAEAAAAGSDGGDSGAGGGEKIKEKLKSGLGWLSPRVLAQRMSGDGGDESAATATAAAVGDGGIADPHRQLFDLPAGGEWQPMMCSVTKKGLVFEYAVHDLRNAQQQQQQQQQQQPQQQQHDGSGAASGGAKSPRGDKKEKKSPRGDRDNKDKEKPNASAPAAHAKQIDTVRRVIFVPFRYATLVRLSGGDAEHEQKEAQTKAHAAHAHAGKDKKDKKDKKDDVPKSPRGGGGGGGGGGDGKVPALQLSPRPAGGDSPNGGVGNVLSPRGGGWNEVSLDESVAMSDHDRYQYNQKLHRRARRTAGLVVQTPWTTVLVRSKHTLALDMFIDGVCEVPNLSDFGAVDDESGVLVTNVSSMNIGRSPRGPSPSTAATPSLPTSNNNQAGNRNAAGDDDDAGGGADALMSPRRREVTEAHHADASTPTGSTHVSTTNVPAVKKPVLHWTDDHGRHESYKIRRGVQTTIGRLAKKNVVAPSEKDRKLSRFHGVISYDGSHCMFTDLGSMSGSRINGVRTEQQLLRCGDKLQLGDCELRFVADIVEPKEKKEKK